MNNLSDEQIKELWHNTPTQGDPSGMKFAIAFARAVLATTVQEDTLLAAAYRDIAALNYDTCYVSLFKAHVQERVEQLRAKASVSEPQTGQVEPDSPVFRDMPNPTMDDLISPTFEAIWRVVKSWDVNVPECYTGYCGATGSHVKMILNALSSPPSVASPSDGDYARWAEQSGAKVDWNEAARPPVFPTWGSWGRFCDKARAAAPDSQGAPKQHFCEKPVAWTDNQMIAFAGFSMYSVSLQHLSIAERLEHFRSRPSDGAQATAPSQEDAS